MDSIAFLETLSKDLRFGARLLRLNPGFALAGVASLACYWAPLRWRQVTCLRAAPRRWILWWRCAMSDHHAGRSINWLS